VGELDDRPGQKLGIDVKKKNSDITSKTLRQTTFKKRVSKERKHIFKCYKYLIA